MSDFNFSPFSTLFLFFPLLFSYSLFLFHVIFSCSLFQHNFLCFSFLPFLLPLVHLSSFPHFFPFCTPCLIFPLFLVMTSLSYLLPFSFCYFACHLFCDKFRVWPWCRPGYQILNQYWCTLWPSCGHGSMYVANNVCGEQCMWRTMYVAYNVCGIQCMWRTMYVANNVCGEQCMWRTLVYLIGNSAK